MMVSWNPFRRLLTAITLIALVGPAAAGDDDNSVVLMEVNGQEITSERIDEMIMRSHRQLDMTQTGEELMVRLLDKAVNDALILQEAVAMGLHEDEGVLEPAEEAATSVAVREFVREHHEAPSAVTDEEIDDFFGDMYHRIQLRRVSLRTREEIDAVRQAVLDGTDMDAIARESSLDSKKPVGGLMNFIHWADLPVIFRGACEDLAVGEVSEPFRNQDAWTIVRVEQRADPDRSELPEYAEFIRGVLLSEKREAAWAAFIDGLRDRTPVTKDEAVLDAIRADEADVLRGEFFNDSEAPALAIDAGHVVSESALRDAVSKTFMEMGDRPFEEAVQEAAKKETARLLLRAHAERDGYFERDVVLEAYDRKLEETLINVYLDETVVSKISFDREEFDAFYEENKHRFRGAAEIKLSFLLLDTREIAEDAYERLEDGADFDYLRRELQGAGHGSDTAKWAPASMFSPEIVEASKEMEIGETSGVLPFNSRWMIVRLDGRRDGDVLPIEEVDMQIRQALFQREFRERLDEKLSLIKERSEIVRHDERIRKYFAAES